MSKITRKAKTLFYLIAHHQLTLVCKIIRNWLFSDAIFLGLQLDLTIPPIPLSAKTSVRIREFIESDLPYIKKWLQTTPVDYDSYLVLNRYNLIREGLQTCYIGVDNNDTPCYLRWMIRSDENDNLERLFKGVFPRLNDDDVLFENVYIPKSHRGQNIYPYATSLVCNIARSEGKKRAITFIDIHNSSTIRGIKKIGFIPYTLRIDQWRFFHRTVKFIPI